MSSLSSHSSQAAQNAVASIEGSSALTGDQIRLAVSLTRPDMSNFKMHIVFLGSDVEFLWGIEAALRNNKPSIWANLLKTLRHNDAPDFHFKSLLYTLAELSPTCHSQLSVWYFLSEAFPANDVMLDHNILNHMITIWGRKNGSEESDWLSNEAQCASGGQGEKRGVDLFNLAICRLVLDQKNLLLAEDTFGHLCLYYGAMYSLPPICQSIVNCAKT